MERPGEITRLLNDWAGGDAAAGEVLAPMVYDELHKLADRIFRSDESSLAGGTAEAELLDLDEALTALAELDPRKAELVQLQYFGGLSFREMETVTGLSSSTLDRDLRMARAWLKDRLSK